MKHPKFEPALIKTVRAALIQAAKLPEEQNHLEEATKLVVAAILHSLTLQRLGPEDRFNKLVVNTQHYFYSRLLKKKLRELKMWKTQYYNSQKYKKQSEKVAEQNEEIQQLKKTIRKLKKRLINAGLLQDCEQPELLEEETNHEQEAIHP